MKVHVLVLPWPRHFHEVRAVDGNIEIEAVKGYRFYAELPTGSRERFEADLKRFVQSTTIGADCEGLTVTMRDRDLSWETGRRIEGWMENWLKVVESQHA